MRRVAATACRADQRPCATRVRHPQLVSRKCRPVHVNPRQKMKPLRAFQLCVHVDARLWSCAARRSSSTKSRPPTGWLPMISALRNACVTVLRTFPKPPAGVATTTVFARAALLRWRSITRAGERSPAVHARGTRTGAPKRRREDVASTSMSEHHATVEGAARAAIDQIVSAGGARGGVGLGSSKPLSSQ